MKRTHPIRSLALACALGVAATTSSQAITLTATNTGFITAYFYGQSAGYGSDIGLWVNGVFQGVYGLQNHLSSPGDSLILGSANAGDTLEFELRVSIGNANGPPPYDYSVWTTPSLNPDSVEHAVASSYSAGEFGIPNGTLVGFEDIIPESASDHDFDDHQFVFTNVSATPDGGTTLALLGGATLGLAGLRRKLKK